MTGRGDGLSRPRRLPCPTQSSSGLGRRARDPRGGHENPDADTLGATLGVARDRCEAAVARATTVCADRPPPPTTVLPGIEAFRADPEPRRRLRPARDLATRGRSSGPARVFERHRDLLLGAAAA